MEATGYTLICTGAGKLICARLTRLQPLTRNSFWRKLPPGPQEFQLRLKCQITALGWGLQAALLSSDVVLPRTLHLRDIIYVSQMKMLLFSKSWKISTRKGIEGAHHFDHSDAHACIAHGSAHSSDHRSAHYLTIALLIPILTMVIQTHVLADHN